MKAYSLGVSEVVRFTPEALFPPAIFAGVQKNGQSNDSSGYVYKRRLWPTARPRCQGRSKGHDACVAGLRCNPWRHEKMCRWQHDTVRQPYTPVISKNYPLAKMFTKKVQHVHQAFIYNFSCGGCLPNSMWHAYSTRHYTYVHIAIYIYSVPGK